MDLKLRFFATFRDAVGGKTLEREFEDGVTVGDVLSTLESDYDGLAGQLLDDEGNLQPQLNILKNGREVLHMEGPDTVLEDGDTLSVFPPVAGGGEP
jgi:molybdopterin synthase sulfur carrier subunit